MEKDPKYPLIEAAFGRQPDRVPIWFMRQAGRYMASYQAIKAKHSFVEMIQTPELAMEVTLQPIDELGVDAAILFSDILVTASAMGCRFDYVEGKGPLFADPIRTAAQVAALRDTVEGRLDFVSNAIQLLLPELHHRNRPLIGFAGAPFTVAAFMIAGKSPHPFSQVRSWMQEHPIATAQLLEKLARVTATYINAQIQAGVHAIQLFDTLLDQLSIAEFEAWAWPYIQSVMAGIQRPEGLPLIMFSKSIDRFWPHFIQLPIQVISVDAHTSMVTMAASVPAEIALQGNLDPQLLIHPPQDLKAQVEAILASMRPRPGFIFNLGHGIIKETNPQTVKNIVEWVHDFR